MSLLSGALLSGGLLFGGLPALAGPADDLPPPPPTPASLAPPDAASIVGLSGAGFVSIAGQAPLALDRCAVLPVGATVCTDADSFATIRLSPDPTDAAAEDIVLLPGTCLDIEERSAGRTQLGVTSGGVSVVSDADAQSAVAVRTRDGLAEGRAGGFRVTLEDAATRTEAVFGAVQLRGAGGALALAAGKGSRLRAGLAPDPPEDLLVSEALRAPEDGAALRRPDFAWDPVPYATGYRLELAATADFSDVVEALDLAEPAWAPDLLFVPAQVPGLWWRVAAYDRFGFLGVPSAARTLQLPGGVGG